MAIKYKYIFYLCASTLCLTAEYANCVTQTVTQPYSAEVGETCTISAGTLNFGAYTGVVNDATANITVTCTNTTPYKITIDKGLGAGATTTTRKMTANNSSATLNYQIFTNSTRTTLWSSNAVSGTGTGAAQIIVAYGRIPAATLPAPANFTDSVTLTILY